VKHWKKILFTVIMLVLTLLGMNFIAGKMSQHPAAVAYEEIYQGHPTRIHALKPGARATIPVGLFGQYAEQWRASGATYDVAINAQGYRDDPFGEKKAFRIVALGDSATFGWDVEAAEAWPQVLERLLRESGREVEVLNLGVPGYSSHQGLLLLPEVWELKPDLLLVAYGRNDELDTAFSPTDHARGRTDAELMPGDRIVEPPPRSLLQRLRASALYRLALRLIAEHKSAPGPDEAKTPDHDDALRRVPLPQYEANLRKFIAQARAHEVPIVLVNIGCFFEQYRAAMFEVAKQKKVKVLNTFPLLFAKVEEIKTDPQYADCRQWPERMLGKAVLNSSPGGWLWFSTDFGHPNACGHQVIAEALTNLIDLPPPGDS